MKVSVDVKSSENGQFSIPISLARIKAKIFVSNEYNKSVLFSNYTNESYSE